MTGGVERLAVVAAALYVLVAGWAMFSLSYDIWGAFIIAPVIVIVTVPLLRRLFTGEHAALFPIALVGLFAKLVGSMYRYWVAFDAYGGSADAGRYHDYGKAAAGNIWEGLGTTWPALPRQVGTPFVEQLTALVYTFIGTSRLAGFFFFAWLGFWGLVLFLRAALVGVPGLAQRRYALLVFLTPSLVYWPSSIGKEAVMCLFLGLASYGGARLLSGRWGGWAVPITLLGIIGARFVRPHFAALWVGALVVGLLSGLLTGRSGRGVIGRLGTITLAVIAVIGLTAVARVTLNYLDPQTEESEGAVVSERITNIFEETERRTEQGGSGFETITISGPQDYPYAIVRTLTRPLLTEARSFAELLPAIEMAALVVLGLASWRRLANLPRMMLSSPYVVFAVVVLVMFGIAFTSVGNLGILTRQRSLVVPLLLLPLCLPPLPRRLPPWARPTSPAETIEVAT
jgi:hypothetical protein